MGGKTTVQNSGTTESKVEIPQEIRDRGTKITEAAMGTYFDPAKQYQPYNAQKYAAVGKATTAPLSGLHQKAAANATAAGSSYQPYIQRADATATAATSNNPASTMAGPDFTSAAIQKFMNPYQQGVIDIGVRQIGDNLTQQRLADQTRAAQAGAFGGARHGVIDAQAQQTAAQTMSDFVGSQLAQGYDKAVGQYNTNFGQEAQATQINNAAMGQNWQQEMSLAQILANLGQQRQAQQIAASDQQAKIGEIFRSQRQLERDNAYNKGYLDHRGYPLDVYERLAAMNAMQPTNRTSTSTTQGTSTQSSPGSWIGPALGAAGNIAYAFSDERTKTDIEDRDPEDVLGAFAKVKPKTYRYTDEAMDAAPDLTKPGERRGFTAQDLEAAFKRPSGPTVAGYKTVDYGNLIGDLVAAVHGIEKRTRKLKAGTR